MMVSSGLGRGSGHAHFPAATPIPLDESLSSRDSATHHGNAAVVAEGDTCMARIRGARGDTVRTGLLRLFKNPLARSGSRKPPVNPAAFGPIASVQELWLNRTARAAHVEGRMSSDSDCRYRSAPCCRRIDAIPAC